MGSPVRHHVAALKDFLSLRSDMVASGRTFFLDFLRASWSKRHHAASDAEENMYDVRLSLHSKNAMHSPLQLVQELLDFDEGVSAMELEYSASKAKELHSMAVRMGLVLRRGAHREHREHPTSDVAKVDNDAASQTCSEGDESTEEDNATSTSITENSWAHHMINHSGKHESRRFSQVVEVDRRIALGDREAVMSKLSEIQKAVHYMVRHRQGSPHGAVHHAYANELAQCPANAFAHSTHPAPCPRIHHHVQTFTRLRVVLL